MPGLRAAGRRLLAPGLLLAGDGALGALAGTRVGLGALATHREAAAVADALVAADLDLAADVRGDLAPQVALELEAALEVVAERDELGVAEVADADVGADARGGQRLLGAGATDAVDVGERDLQPLLAGEVDSDKTCYVSWSLRTASEVFRTAFPRVPRAPASDRGFAVPYVPGGGVAVRWVVPARGPGRHRCSREPASVRVSPGAACDAGSRRSP